jgi:2'-5' RNA ligase
VTDRHDATPPTHRLFIAVALPPESLAACRELLAAVSSAPSVVAAPGRVRWTQPDNLHLTLRFLGATDPALAPAIGVAMEDVASVTAPFAVSLSGAGAFPRSGPPRTMWLGIGRGREELTSVAHELDARLAARLGIGNGSGPYHPHLTVARAGRGQPEAAAATIAALRTAAAGWSTAFDAREIRLYRSHLGSGPPRYEALASIALHS